MLYDIEVRPGRDTEFFQYYTETVEALTSHDAVARVQRRNPGCDVRCTRSYNEDGGGSSLSDMGDMGSWLILGAIVFCLWIIVEYWWIVVPIAALVALGWIFNKTKHWWDR